MQKTPKGFRLHIGIFGRRNVGKSSILNAMTRQSVSIVSDTAGTTTDPVEKPMELLPLGPVLFIDTAGVDDTGALGEMRVDKTRQVFDRTDIGVIVTTPTGWGEFEKEILAHLKKRKIPAMVIFNKCDLGTPDQAIIDQLEAEKIPHLCTIATEKKGVLELREQLIQIVPEEFIKTPSIIGDLLPAGDLAMLVVPIDMEAPKGRIILPQVQTIRDVLDNEATCLICKDRDLSASLSRLKTPPAVVVTDSQAFEKVAADTPEEIPLTSFSILFARLKGDLETFVEGAMQIGKLKTGSKVLIAESCSHHPIGDDIGRVKIPNWLREFVGGELEISVTQGHDFPENLSEFDLVIHCGGCMWNRREILSRILHCKDAGVPITNYGLTIAYTLGIFDRALKPFPNAQKVYESLKEK